MKKFIAFILIPLLVLCGCDSYNKFSSEVKGISEINNNDSSSYYPILGESSNLSEASKDSMDIWRKYIVDLANKNKDLIFINGPENSRNVALTFDDGPDNKVTPKVLDILKNKGVNASFFFLGDNIDKYPEIALRTFEEGNLVLNHSTTHKDLSKLSKEDFAKEVDTTDDKIKNLIGKTPNIIRPPYGAISNLDEYKERNLKIALWSIDTLDWSKRDKDNILSNVTDNIRPGDIILMHTSLDTEATAEALPLIIDYLKENNFNIVTLDKLLGIPPYKSDDS
ncbi:polysaccharide deacetylase family protein [Clostridium sp.]|uniref:polysaccharide deacetylase family protein n=1 Tax=Clostridium sp. TaxID=1506 RepID=UPI0034647BC8